MWYVLVCSNKITGSKGQSTSEQSCLHKYFIYWSLGQNPWSLSSYFLNYGTDLHINEQLITLSFYKTSPIFFNDLFEIYFCHSETIYNWGYNFMWDHFEAIYEWWWGMKTEWYKNGVYGVGFLWGGNLTQTLENGRGRRFMENVDSFDGNILTSAELTIIILTTHI